MRLALIGAGSRGMIYSRYAHDVLGAEIVALADPVREKREYAQNLFGTRKTGEDLLYELPHTASGSPFTHYSERKVTCQPVYGILHIYVFNSVPPISVLKHLYNHLFFIFGFCNIICAST